MSQGQHSNIGTLFFALGFSLMMILDYGTGVRGEEWFLWEHASMPALSSCYGGTDCGCVLWIR